MRWRGRELYRDTESAGGPRRQGEGSPVRLDDSLDDGQAEADTFVIGVDALAAALERLDKRGDQLSGELLTRVLDGEHHTLRANAGRDPYGALFGQVVDDRVVHEVRGHLL